MKNKIFTIIGLISLAGLSLAPTDVKAQETIQYFRPNSRQGINVFETSKLDTVKFTGLKVKVGGNFELTFQALGQSNTAIPLIKTGFNGNVNSLMPITHAFQLPMAKPEC